MLSRAQAVEVARSFLGTPYQLRGRIKGAGLDCGTLLAEYLIEIGRFRLEELIDLGFYSNDWFHHTTKERYLAQLMRAGALVAETICRGGQRPESGNLALFKAIGSKRFNHGAIITAWPMGIAALQKGVLEVDLTSHWLTAQRPMDIFNPWGAN